MKYLLLVILIITITGNAMSGPQYRKKLGIQSFIKNKSTTEKEFYKAFKPHLSGQQNIKRLMEIKLGKRKHNGE